MLPRNSRIVPQKPPLRRRVWRAMKAPVRLVQKLVPKKKEDEYYSDTDIEEKEERAKKEEVEQLFRYYQDKKPPVSPYKPFWLSLNVKKSSSIKKTPSIKKMENIVIKQVERFESLSAKPFDPTKNVVVEASEGGIVRSGTIRRGSWRYEARIRPRQKITVPVVFLKDGPVTHK